jgi:hypothetical protein
MRPSCEGNKKIEVKTMNKTKILDVVEKDFLTLRNLERSIQFALKSRRGTHYQLKVMHAAFRRTCDILLKRRTYIAKQLGLKLQLLKDPSS